MGTRYRLAKPRKKKARRGGAHLHAMGVRVVKPPKKRQPKHTIPTAQLAEAIPDAGAIQKLLASLGPADQDAVNRILQGLEQHLGSSQAARVWLAVNSPEFGTTPLEAIRSGKAVLLLSVLEARWGQNPAYA